MALYLGNTKIASGGTGSVGTAGETTVDNFKLNCLTEAQYQDALITGTINENELYMTPDDGSNEIIDLTNEITNYNSKKTAAVGSFKKSGNSYCLIISITSSSNYSNNDILFKIPSAYCPSDIVILTSARDGSNQLLTIVIDNGECIIKRTSTATNWLQITANWIK